MKRFRAALLGLWCCLATAQLPARGAELVWRQLPPLPNPLGVAGAFAGVSDGALLVAGGANFPDRMPWAGGAKIWHDQVFLLEKPAGPWRSVGKLPRPLGYGVAISHRRGLICVGGSDALEHHAEAFTLVWRQGRLRTEPLPPLPVPIAHLSGALLGDTLYVVGGQATPNATNALPSAYALNLASRKPRWETLPPLPGPGRMLAAVGRSGNSFYVLGGAALRAGPEGKPVREWLREAWRYTPGQGWTRLADLPRAAVAAPSPAPVFAGQLLVLGGDDGTQVNTPPADHRGFRRDILAYDPKADRWETRGELPFAHVTTSLVEWRNLWVVPSGEIRPGVRSPEVWAAPR